MVPPADDIADNQDMGGELGDQSDLAGRLALIRRLTALAFEGQPTGDPAFDALGVVAAEVGLTPQMAEDVIAGFQLDAEDWRPRTEADMLRYCYHVAGAVGVMMAVVMGVSPDDQETLDRANDLGLAFQLSNIARDIVEDDAAGRCYLPIMWLVEQDIEPGQHTKPHHRKELAAMAARLVALVEKHEAAARVGAAKLPFRSRWACCQRRASMARSGARSGRAGPRRGIPAPMCRARKRRCMACARSCRRQSTARKCPKRDRLGHCGLPARFPLIVIASRRRGNPASADASGRKG